jgi:cytochrome c556
LLQSNIRFAAALGAALVLSSCGGAEPDLPYGTTQLMMANEVQPTAEAYWDSVRYVSELVDGEAIFTEYEPKTPEDWARVEAAAVKLGELAETLKTPAYADGRGEDWAIFAQGLVDVSKRAQEAAQSRDPDKVFEVGGLVYNVCSACHQVYPPLQVPEGQTSLEPSPESVADDAT